MRPVGAAKCNRSQDEQAGDRAYEIHQANSPQRDHELTQEHHCSHLTPGAHLAGEGQHGYERAPRAHRGKVEAKVKWTTDQHSHRAGAQYKTQERERRSRTESSPNAHGADAEKQEKVRKIHVERLESA